MLLPDDEQKELLALREFLAAEVRPRVNAAWAAAEFPMDLVARFAEADIVGRSYDWDDATQREQFGRPIAGLQLIQDLLARMPRPGTVAWARELFGGNGIVPDHDVVRVCNDAEALYSYEGPGR